MEGATDRTCLEFEPSSESGKDGPTEVSLPYPVSAEIKVLTAPIGQYGVFIEHFLAHRAKAQLRQGLLAQVLQITHDAIITSLLRYGWVMLGSCLPPDRMEARRISGLGRSVRLESLHFPAATRSYVNLYIIRCAEMIDAVLRTENSKAKTR